jgi:ADP-ribose pyrophosphatase
MAYLDNVIVSTNWLEFIKRSYNHNGKSGEWDFIRRTQRGDSNSIIVVVARTPSDSIIVIKQFRIPFDDYVYELPAGLVDDGETLREAAIRELSEETGYAGVITSVGGPISSSTGLTNETVNMVYMDVGEYPAFNQRLEDEEDIEVMKISKEDIPEFLRKNEEGGHVFGAKLYCVLKGMV